MQASTPLSPQAARSIALRQGLLLGTFAGCLALLGTACSRFVPLIGFSFNFMYVLAFIAFFIAGWRTAKRTGRIDMGALAGFWAGVAVAVLGIVTLVIALSGLLGVREVRLSEVVRSLLSSFPIVLLALLLGPAIGALGGFIGKTYAENPAAQPAPSAQVTSSTQPATPVQPAQPAPPQQNQP